MTREQEILHASKKHKDALFDNYGDAFIAGAEWADEHPVNVWNYASEEPKEHSKIVIIDTEGEWWNIDYASDNFDGYGLYGWAFCIEHYNLKMWAYIDDLLPQGGEK